MLHLFFYCMNNKLEVCKKQMCQNAKNFGQKGKDTFFIPPRGGGLLRRSRAFSATLTERFGMGAVRMGTEGRW
jgi:hypothetical protein